MTDPITDYEKLDDAERGYFDRQYEDAAVNDATEVILQLIVDTNDCELCQQAIQPLVDCIASIQTLQLQRDALKQALDTYRVSSPGSGAKGGSSNSSDDDAKALHYAAQCLNCGTYIDSVAITAAGAADKVQQWVTARYAIQTRSKDRIWNNIAANCNSCLSRIKSRDKAAANNS